MDVDLPLSLKPLTEDVSLDEAIQDRRLLCFPFPRRVLRRVVGAASRFYDMSFASDPRHTYDLIFASFFIKTLQMPGLVGRLERAFVDDSDSKVITFLLLFKDTTPVPNYTVSAFVKDTDSIVTANNMAIFGQQQQQQQQDADASPPANGRKKRRVGTAPEIINAYTLIGRPTVPVDHIRQMSPFNTRITTWGELLCTTADVEHALKQVFKSRFLDLGQKVIAIGPTAPAPAQAATALSDDASDTGDDEEEADPNTGGAAAAAAAANPTFHFESSPPVTLTLALDEYVQVTHPITSRFLRASLVNNRILPAHARDLWEMAAPAVDLPHLGQRYLANTNLYDTFTLYSQGMRAKKDALEANPRGDLSTLSSFFSEHPDARDSDKVAAARLVFDVLTRPDGRLPKATSETMAVFVDALAKSEQKLPAGSGTSVKVYNNLTYSGNYAIHVLEQFETVGTFNFHVEQFVTMMVLDGVLQRPRHEDDDEDQSNVGMCANLLNYGPPGVGKSNASLFFLSAHPSTYVPNTYSSLRSIYSNLLCSDFLNGKASYNDEAPAWIPESGGKRAPQERDMIAHLKERLSSGKMMGERLVRDDSKGIHRTVMFNVDVQHSPQVMNTNAPERSGEAPLLERFVLRYFIFGPRAAPHALVLGAPPPPPEVKKGIRREFLLQRVMGIILSKLQIDGIVSFPCKLVFKSYYERFLAELRLNPWIDCDPPTSGDRRSSIIENMYGFMVNRMAIHRLFIEPGGKYAEKPFHVEHLLEVEREMATGDMQTAILAIGAYSHSFRSPTEYRVADLLSSLAVTRLTREYKKKAAEEGMSVAARAFYEAGPKGVAAWSPAQESALEPFLGNKEMDEEERFLGSKYPKNTAGVRPFLGSRYLPVTVLAWGSHTPTKFEACDMLAHVLLEGQAGNSNKIMVEHACKRLHLLSTIGARCGDDVGYTPVVLHNDTPNRKTHVCVLASWMEDTTKSFHHSMHSMLARAATACSFTAPGTYLTLEPFTFARHPEEAATFGGFKGAVPKMLPYFKVPEHEATCAFQTMSCTCFRSKRVPAQLGVEAVYADPQLVAVGKFRRTRCADAVMPPVCIGAPMSYPNDCLEVALKKPSVTRSKAREVDEVEKAIEAEYLELIRRETEAAAAAAAAAARGAAAAAAAGSH